MNYGILASILELFFDHWWSIDLYGALAVGLCTYFIFEVMWDVIFSILNKKRNSYTFYLNDYEVKILYFHENLWKIYVNPGEECPMATQKDSSGDEYFYIRAGSVYDCEEKLERLYGI